jgi:broad specificity phosphatase PhoE
LASRWTDTPNLIVTSPYTRARQTAQPTIDRFPHVPVEVWPVEEFTYLVPTRWNGTTFEERRPITENYWTTCDPDLCDGPGAESFSALLRRAEAALARLSSLPADSTALAFTHGQFMRAVRITVLYPGAGDLEKMQAFSADNTGIHNGGSLEFQFQRGRWSST